MPYIKPLYFLAFIILFFLNVACSPASRTEKVKIALNPWPGYEFLYLAAQIGLYEKNGLNVEIVEFASLDDSKNAFLQKKVDGFASTVIEAVHVANARDKAFKIILLPDYSNGSDVLLAQQGIDSIEQLKGKKVGAELGGLGGFILLKALETSGLSFDDIEYQNIAQLNAVELMKESAVDALVSYSPFSIRILKDQTVNNLFSSADIPKEVIDIISVSDEVLEKQPDFIEKMHLVWQQALDYSKHNQQKAYDIIAKREGISTDDFKLALEGVSIISASEQNAILRSSQLKNNVTMVCQTLNKLQKLNYDCLRLTELITLK